MKFRIFLSVFIIFNYVSKAQVINICDVYHIAYDSLLKTKYARVFISDSTRLIKIESEEKIYNICYPVVGKNIVRKMITSVKSAYITSKVNCFPDSQLVNRKAILNREFPSKVSINLDTAFIKIIDKRQFEIFNISNLEERQLQLNQLTLTPEFKKYEDYMDYTTSRGVFFSEAVIIKNVCFFEIEVFKRLPDDRFSYFCIFKKVKGVWSLVKAMAIF